VALVSAALLAAPAPAFLPLGVLVLGLLALARSTAVEVATVVRGFVPFLLFFVGLGVIFEPTWNQAGFLSVQASRLTLLLLLGQFLFFTATPSDVTEGIRWYLGWLGARRAWAAASMGAWALGSVPQVLDQAASLADAAALRGLSPRKKPLATMKLLTLALLVKTVSRSTDLASALEARGFGRHVPESHLRSTPGDWAGLGATVVWVVASWLLVPGGILGA
jgi:energy-coupling factor transporter transmembrane protein EcfT